MNRILLFAIVAFSYVGAAEPEPILVVQEMDPWRMVVGSDSAKFAIYDDGSVIYQTANPTAERPFSRRRIDDPAKEPEKLLGFDLKNVGAEYELSLATDQISTLIWTPERQIEIYGDWRKPLTISSGDDPDLKAIDERERKMWEALPKEVRTFLARIEQEQGKAGEPWLPANIEVMFWPYEYAPEASIIWPAGWPDLKSNTTRKWGEDSYKVFLASKSFPELRKFVSTQNEKGAVLINDKKMAISYRFPFPGELKWRQ